MLRHLFRRAIGLLDHHSGWRAVSLSSRSARNACLALGATLLVAGCAARANDPAPGDYRGVVLVTPLAKPEFTLTATDGRPFDFRRETDGSVTLLFFGYTHCPDICPVHMANIAAVLHRLPYSVASKVKVVFVTTDPARDSLPRIREWLNNFDPSFVGLRGPIDEVNRIQIALALPPAVAQPKQADGDYSVGHSAQVIAFTADDSAHVLYPFGTRQEDWAHDLPKLVQATAWGAGKVARGE
jgi:protein SCO1/2